MQKKRIPVYASAAFLLLYGLLVWSLPGSAEVSPALLHATSLSPFGAPHYPLWSLMVRILAELTPAAYLTVLISFFSILCGAASLFFLASITHMLAMRLRLPALPLSPTQSVPGTVLASVVAALLCGFSLPIVFVSTRPNPEGLGLLMSLCLVWLLLQPQASPRQRRMLAALWGISLLETPIASWLIIGFMSLLIKKRYRQKIVPHLRELLPIGGTTLAVGILLTASLHTTLFWGDSQAMSWLASLRATLGTRLTSLPGGGSALIWWILALVALIGLLVSRVTNPYRNPLEQPLPLLVASLLVLLTFSQLPPSPWLLAGPRPLTLSIYSLGAVAGGCLATQWIVFIKEVCRPRPRRTWKQPLMRLHLGLILLLMIPLAAHSISTLRELDVPQERVFADDLLDGIGSRRWLISDGALDPILLLRAWEREQDVQVINMQRNHDVPYVRLLAKKMDFADTEHESLAELVHHWFLAHPEQRQNLALVSWDAFWRAHGFHPVAQGLWFAGLADGESASAVFDGQVALRDRPYSTQHARTPLWIWIQEHMARLANEAAVTLHQQHNDEAALQLLEAARFWSILNPAMELNRWLLDPSDGETMDWQRGLSRLNITPALFSHERTRIEWQAHYGSLITLTPEDIREHGLHPSLQQLFRHLHQAPPLDFLNAELALEIHLQKARRSYSPLRQQQDVEATSSARAARVRISRIPRMPTGPVLDVDFQL